MKCMHCGTTIDGYYGLQCKSCANRVDFAALVRRELASAREGHNPINSLHEGYAVILEEMDEVWDEIKKKRSQRDPAKLLAELVQIAAMCQRTAEDCALVAQED